MTENSDPIVVGINRSFEALEAARWAGAVADRLGVSLHIVNAVPDLGRESSEVILRTTQEGIRGEYPALVVTTASVTEPADEALIAVSRMARLLVLGCDGVTGTGAQLVGSTTLATVARAACPIVAWRGASTKPTDQPIVVGMDGSASDGGALGVAFELADRLGVPLRVIHCWQQHPLLRCITGPTPTEWDEATQAQWQHVNEVIDTWRDLHPRVNVTVICEPAKPSQALVLQAMDSQLIVAGSRRGHTLAQVLFGSTSLNLLHHSKVPIVLCPFDEHGWSSQTAGASVKNRTA